MALYITLSRSVSDASSPVVRVEKNLPANERDERDMVHSLGWEDPLEKVMETHSSILAWRIPWTEEPGGLVHGVAKSQTQLSDLAHTQAHFIEVITMFLVMYV